MVGGIQIRPMHSGNGYCKADDEPDTCDLEKITVSVS